MPLCIEDPPRRAVETPPANSEHHELNDTKENVILHRLSGPVWERRMSQPDRMWKNVF